MSNIKCVGLFGTCGDSAWRAPFVSKYEVDGVKYFNPVVPDWTPECAQVEARHLAGDAIVVMAITGETTAAASLVEAGLMVARAIMEPTKRFVLFVEAECDLALEGAKDSNRARRLLAEHLGHFKEVKNLLVVQGLDEALEVSLQLWEELES